MAIEMVTINGDDNWRPAFGMVNGDEKFRQYIATIIGGNVWIGEVLMGNGYRNVDCE